MSEHRVLIGETAERLFRDLVTASHLEAAERRELPTALFEALDETGMTLLLVSEQHGGIGSDVGDAVSAMRMAGYAAAPGPILETIVANGVLAAVGREPLGIATIALVAGDPTAATTLHDVPWGEAATSIVVVGDGAVEICTPADWRIIPGVGASDEPRDRMERVKSGERLAFAGDDVLRQASLLRAGQMVGAIDWALERSIEYAGERMQFGRAIGKFQAVQQLLAVMADHALASAAITLAAGEAFNDTLVAAARSRLADAADAAIEIAHQVHGAIGFSREYPLNYRTRRLIDWRDDYGTSAHWSRLLARRFVGLSYDKIWPAIVAESAR